MREVFAPAVIGNHERFLLRWGELRGRHEDGPLAGRRVVFDHVFRARRSDGVFDSNESIAASNPACRSERFLSKVRGFEDTAEPLAQFFTATKFARTGDAECNRRANRSEEHTSELQSRFGISYAVFCLK